MIMVLIINKTALGFFEKKLSRLKVLSKKFEKLEILGEKNFSTKIFPRKFAGAAFKKSCEYMNAKKRII